MPDIPAVAIGAMIEFPPTFRRDRVRISTPSTEDDREGVRKVNAIGPITPVTIACQVSFTNQTAPTRRDASEGAPNGVIDADIMFGSEGLDALIAGGIVDPVIGDWLATDTLVEWIGNNRGDFPAPRPMRARGSIFNVHGDGSRNTLTVTLSA